MRRLISTILVGSIFMMCAGPALAAVAGDPGPRKTYDEFGVGPSSTAKSKLSREELLALQESPSWEICYDLGAIDGENVDTGSSVGGGLAAGVMLGLIGVLVAVYTQKAEDPLFEDMEQITDPNCRFAYIESFRRTSKAKKRSRALVASLGSALIVGTIYLARQN